MRSGNRYRRLDGGGFRLQAYLASLSDGFYYDFQNAATTWQDTGATTPADDIGEAIGLVVDRRSGANSPRNATQGTASLKPLKQAAGAKFDGSDDNLLSAYTPGTSTGEFIVALVTVPASLAITQVVCGVTDSLGRGINLALSTGGLVRTFSTNVGTTDLRGARAVIGTTSGSSNYRAFENGAQVAEASLGGVLVAGCTTAHRVGSFNNAGTASLWYAGHIERVICGPEYLTLARYLQIRSALLS